MAASSIPALDSSYARLRAQWRRMLAAGAGLLLAACATPPAPQVRHDDLLHDELFASAATIDIDPRQVFALSDAMSRYLNSHIRTRIKSEGVQGALIDALLEKGDLKLDYDARVTRTAAEAFEARAGNCLSLVIMTAAFAKELGLQVRYQSAFQDEAWSRKGNLLLRTGHVNLTLGPPMQNRHDPLRYSYTIDFLPPEDAHKLRTREISEETVVGMFMNNRAVEALANGRTDEAYAWSRAAVGQSPAFTAAVNTLGVIYARRGALPHAEAAFQRVLQLDPTHTRAMSNLVDIYLQQGQVAKADALKQTLARLEPEPPYHFFTQGMAALQRNDLLTARDMFAREVARADYSPEFHYWLGVTHQKLGNAALATKHLNLALKNSAGSSEKERYSAKLSQLKTQGLQH